MAIGTTNKTGGSLDNSNPSLGLAFDGSGLELTCDCGHTMVANEALRGMLIKCVQCDAPLEVPLEDADPLMAAAPEPTAATPTREAARPGWAFRGMGVAVGVLVLLGTVIVPGIRLDSGTGWLMLGAGIVIGVLCMVAGYRAGAKVDASIAASGVARGDDV